jgi:hypothetical protein
MLGVPCSSQASAPRWSMRCQWHVGLARREPTLSWFISRSIPFAEGAE